MNLNEYVMYENIDVSSFFDNISKKLKTIHNNGLIVRNLNCNQIRIDDDLSFENIGESQNFEQEKRENLITLSKIMIGLVLSTGNTFRDFSYVDDDWFIKNFDNIFSVININDFDKEYFNSLYFEGKDMYYCDYLAEKKKQEELAGRENVNSYRKVLRTAASSLYQDMSEEDISDIQEKSALISTSFNPILLISISAIILILTIFLLLIN